MTKKENPIAALAAAHNLSVSQIYRIAQKLGRLPTDKEIENRQKVGRPTKY